MPADKITYPDQVDDGGTTSQGRWTSDNADEVRDVVNSHADDLDALGALSDKDTIDSASLIDDGAITEQKLDAATQAKLNYGGDPTNLTWDPDNSRITSSTGDDADLTVADGTNPGLMKAEDKVKLDTVSSNATANSSDSELRDRTTHTGTQLAATISDLDAVISANPDVVDHAGQLESRYEDWTAARAASVYWEVSTGPKGYCTYQGFTYKLIDAVNQGDTPGSSASWERVIDLNYDAVALVKDRTALGKIDTAQKTTAYLLERGRAGQFSWDGSDLSAEVAIDTLQGIYVAPDSDATGASGAWVRDISGGLNLAWFGATGLETQDASPALQSAMNILPDTRLIEDGSGTATIHIPQLTSGNEKAIYRFDTEVLFPDKKSVTIDGGLNIGPVFKNNTGTDYILGFANTSAHGKRTISGIAFHQGGIACKDRQRGWLYIERCAFFETPSYGVLLQNDSGGLGPVNVKVTQCEFRESYGGINVDASSYLIYTIDQCRFREMRDVSIEINGPGGYIGDCDFQGMETAAKPHIWFSGNPTNSADTNATSWRVEGCRFGNEVVTVNSIDYDVPETSIVFGESGQTPTIGTIALIGNQFRGRSGGGTATNAVHAIRLYTKPINIKVKDNAFSYASYYGATVKQDWIADPDSPTIRESYGEGSEWLRNSSLAANGYKAIRIFDNGDGALTENGVGWHIDSNRDERYIFLEGDQRISCGSNHGLSGGETSYEFVLRVALETTSPTEVNSLFGSSSARNYMSLNTDGTLSFRLRVDSPSFSEITSGALPQLKKFAPIFIKGTWTAGGNMELLYSLDSDHDQATWVSLGTTAAAGASLSTTHSSTSWYLGYKNSTIDTQNEGTGRFYSFHAIADDARVMEFDSRFINLSAVLTADTQTGENWTVPEDAQSGTHPR